MFFQHHSYSKGGDFHTEVAPFVSPHSSVGASDGHADKIQARFLFVFQQNVVTLSAKYVVQGNKETEYEEDVIGIGDGLVAAELWHG
ncbi:MAG: hypothetical protein K2H92_03715 [Bacteroidaceae bacterium]|nr:hypothetical protein [Bacteroidaceae bacterium]